MTYERVKALTDNDHILVVTNEDLKESIKKQLPNIPEKNVIAEPFGRNTAPCIGLAGTIIRKREPNSNDVMVVLPADHLIPDEEQFRDALKVAAQYASQEKVLITMGIRPSYPETGYGYIQKSSPITTIDDRTIYKVKTFAEKPNMETAERFLESGDFLWNSGMFIWSLPTIMSQFEEHLPEIAESMQRLSDYVDTEKMDETIYDIYSRLRSTSIDYGIMEVADNVCVIEADFRWNDVGSWEAVYKLSEKDTNGNSVHADAFVNIEAQNNLIFSDNKLVAMVGVENLVVVETEDAILICKMDRSQDVKDVVDQLKRKKMKQYL